MLKTRTMSAIIGLPLLFFVLIKGGIYLKISLMILSVLGLDEFYNSTKHLNTNPAKLIGFFSVPLIYIMQTLIKELDIIILLALIILFLPLVNKKYNIKDCAVTLTGIIYIPMFFLYIDKIRGFENGFFIVWFVFITSWMTDTFAYFIGRHMGKHKLIPSISPNKTIEGSIGGILGAVIGDLIFALFISKLKLNIFFIVSLGIVGSIIAQLGDLVASAIKRNCNIKDYGNIIPGHGGILDRFDSILYVSPIIYFLFKYIY